MFHWEKKLALRATLKTAFRETLWCRALRFVFRRTRPICHAITRIASQQISNSQDTLSQESTLAVHCSVQCSVCRMGSCLSAQSEDYEDIERNDEETLFSSRHGEGTYLYANGVNGDVKGQWKWGMKHGHGVYTHGNGEMWVAYI